MYVDFWTEPAAVSACICLKDFWSAVGYGMSGTNHDRFCAPIKAHHDNIFKLDTNEGGRFRSVVIPGDGKGVSYFNCDFKAKNTMRAMKRDADIEKHGTDDATAGLDFKQGSHHTGDTCAGPKTAFGDLIPRRFEDTRWIAG